VGSIFSENFGSFEILEFARIGELEFLNPHPSRPRNPRFKSFGKKTKKSSLSVPRFSKLREVRTEKIQKVVTRFWRFGSKRPFTLKFHPHHNRS
jgi:hypothetical protein